MQQTQKYLSPLKSRVFAVKVTRIYQGKKKQLKSVAQLTAARANLQQCLRL